MSIAYVVLSHARPQLVRRLSQRLLDGDPACQVVVEHDAGGPALDLDAHPRLHVRTGPRSGGWGGFGLVSSVLDALRYVQEEIDPEWVVLVSGQDYPAQPPAAIRTHLKTCGQDALLDLWRTVPPAGGDYETAWWRARYYMRWYALPRAPFRLPFDFERRRAGLQRRLSFAQPWVFVWSLPRNAGTRVGFRRRGTPFTDAWPCRAGSQWFALRRPALRSVFEQIERRPELVPFFRRTIIPDEAFFNTLIGNDGSLRVATENLTFFRPDGAGKSHAAVLELADLPAIDASGRPFLRKVEEERSASLMDALDER